MIFLAVSNCVNPTFAFFCPAHAKEECVVIDQTASIAAAQCRFILEQFVSASDFRVVVFHRTGEVPQHGTDIPIIKSALSELGVKL